MIKLKDVDNGYRTEEIKQSFLHIVYIKTHAVHTQVLNSNHSFILRRQQVVS